MNSEFAPLTITHETNSRLRFDSHAIKTLFNPSELTYTKKANWEKADAAIRGVQSLEFKSSELETLALSLFFDTYETAANGGLSDILGTGGKPEVESMTLKCESVLNHTSRVLRLLGYSPTLHRPPICLLAWGKAVIFRGVLDSVTQKLTMFLDDGTPVRATLECNFTQYHSMDAGLVAKVDPGNDKLQYIVLPGDTLESIASFMYEDPTKWREIAEENKIDNPKELELGKILEIPSLR